MNSDSPKTPREEMEAWLTALLLGELSAGEAAAVRELMAHDPELAQLHARLQQAIVLVREAMPEMASPPAAADRLQLSDERRQRLLTSFKIPPLKKQDQKPRHSLTSSLLVVAAVMVIGLLLAAIAIPNFTRARTAAMSNSVINQLRQLDGAKQQWALEQHKSASDTPTLKDLTPYLRNEPQSLMGENYIMGSVAEPVTAEVDASRAKKVVGKLPGSGFFGGSGRDRVRFSSEGGVTVVGQDDSQRAFLSRNGAITLGASGTAVATKPAQRETSPSPPGLNSAIVAGEATASARGMDRGKPAAQTGLAFRTWGSEPSGERYASGKAPGANVPPAATPPPVAQIVLPPATDFDAEGRDKVAAVVAADAAPVGFAVPVTAPVQLQPPPPATPAAPPPAATKPVEKSGDLYGNYTFSRQTVPVTNSMSADDIGRFKSFDQNLARGSKAAVGGGAGGGGGGGQGGADHVVQLGGIVLPNDPASTLQFRERLNRVERRAANGVALADGDEKVPVFGDTPTAGKMYRAKSVDSAGATDGQSQLQPAREPEALGKIVAQGGTPPAAGGNFGVSAGAVPVLADSLEPEEVPPANPSAFSFRTGLKRADAGGLRLLETNAVVSLGNEALVEAGRGTLSVSGANNFDGKTTLYAGAPATPLPPTEQKKGLATYNWFDSAGNKSVRGGDQLTRQEHEVKLSVADDFTAVPAKPSSSSTIVLPRMEAETSRVPNRQLRVPVSRTAGEASQAQASLPAGEQSRRRLERQIAQTSRELEAERKTLAISDMDAGGVAPTPSLESDVVRKTLASELESKARLLGREATLTNLKSVSPEELRQIDKTRPYFAKKRELEELINQKRLSAIEQAHAAPVRKPSTNAPIPQPEIQTSENNFSTFSLNVSDVSFKLAAASLEKGQMPDAASVRSEEFINAFDYRDPEPPAGAPIAFAWERARYPFAHNRDLLRFSLKTAAAGRQAGRPLNIVLLLDNSGSMERADRVRIIREALRVLAEQLQPQDKLSVITFARTARLWVDGAPGSDAGAVAMAATEITPQGGTNLEDAMNLAYQTAAKHYLAKGINRVVVLTDGAANLGNVEPESLKQKVEAQRKQGIALDCFGIGWEGFNDDLLEVLSRNGDGRYGFINSPEEAATDFVGQLAGALKVAASDVKVQVEFNPKRVTSYRQIGYAKHQLTKEQFRDNTVDAAEIAAREAGNALYTVEVNPAGEGPLGTVRVRYKIPGTADYREQAWDVAYTGNAVSLEQSSPAMRLAASASAFSEWLVASPFAGEVTPNRVLGVLSGVPEVFGADSRPKKLEWMIRQAKSLEGK